MSNAMLHLVTFKLGMAHSTNDAFECARDHFVIIRQACFPQFDSVSPSIRSIVLHASRLAPTHPIIQRDPSGIVPNLTLTSKQKLRSIYLNAIFVLMSKGGFT